MFGAFLTVKPADSKISPKCIQSSGWATGAGAVTDGVSMLVGAEPMFDAGGAEGGAGLNGRFKRGGRVRCASDSGADAGALEYGNRFV